MTNFADLPFELRLKILKINTKKAFHARIQTVKRIFVPKVLHYSHAVGDYWLHETNQKKKISICVQVNLQIGFEQIIFEMQRKKRQTYSLNSDLLIIQDKWERKENVWNYKFIHRQFQVSST